MSAMLISVESDRGEKMSCGGQMSHICGRGGQTGVFLLARRRVSTAACFQPCQPRRGPPARPANFHTLMFTSIHNITGLLHA